MIELRKEILYQQNLYYNQNKTEITDKEFDIKFKELQNLEEKYPEFKTKNSPTQKIGSDLSQNFQKSTHKIHMLSLENTYDTASLNEWIAKIGINETYSIQWKIDGSSVALYYEEGVLVKALTRGDGKKGELITENIKTISNLPKTLKENINVILKGEIFICYDDFEKINFLAGNRFANPRNLAAGTLKHKNIEEVKKRPLNIFLYDAVFINEQFSNYQKVFQKMKNLSFPVIPNVVFAKGKEILEEIKIFETKRKNTNFPNDGLVISLCNLTQREQLGYTARVPRWSKAFKFETETANTKILDISIGVGRTGKITPKAHLKPIFLSGTTVSYATLHNQDFITKNKIDIGAEVKISKRGEIIPAVESVIKETGEIFQISKNCPSCQKPLSQVEDLVDYFCLNESCQEKKLKLLIYFCEREQMNIEGLGKKQIEFLYQNKFISNISDIYKLYQFKDKLLSQKNFGEKRVILILEAIEKSKKQSFETTLASFGFSEITKNTVKILIENQYNSLEKIFELVSQENALEILESTKGLGKSTASKIISTFKDYKNIQFLEEMKKIGLNFTHTKEKNLPFKNQIWVLTGTFIHFQPREKATSLIEKGGGTVSKSISQKTDFLLSGVKSGSKFEKAKKLNIKILNEEDFIKILKKFHIHF